jgi:hypothetical protein
MAKLAWGTQQKLIDNWSDYNIWFGSAVIVFDPKNDDKKILVGSRWGKVKDQETWTEIVKVSTTSHGNISPIGADYAMTRVREIWSPDNQFYGYIIHQRRDMLSAKLVDDNYSKKQIYFAYQNSLISPPPGLLIFLE